MNYGLDGRDATYCSTYTMQINSQMESYDAIFDQLDRQNGKNNRQPEFVLHDDDDYDDIIHSRASNKPLSPKPKYRSVDEVRVDIPALSFRVQPQQPSTPAPPVGRHGSMSSYRVENTAVYQRIESVLKGSAFSQLPNGVGEWLGGSAETNAGGGGVSHKSGAGPRPPTASSRHTRPLVFTNANSRVQHRIAEAEKNPEDFKQRAKAAIKIRHAREYERGNMIERNIERAATPRIPHGPTVDERLQQHLAKHVEVFHAQQEHRRRLLNRREEMKIEREGRRQQLELEAEVKDLLVMLVWSARTKLFLNQGLRIVAFRQGMNAYHTLRICFHRWSVFYEVSKFRRNTRRARIKLRFTFFVLRFWLPIRKRRDAAMVVKAALRQIREASVFVRASRKLLLSTRLIQRNVRKFLVFKMTRLKLLLEYIDIVERDIRARYVTGNSVLTSSLPKRMFTSKMTDEQRVKALLKYDPFNYSQPIPFTLKLLFAEKEFRSGLRSQKAAMQVYKKQMHYFTKKMAERKMTGATTSEPVRPVKPYLSVIPTPERLEKLVENTLETYIDRMMYVKRTAAEKVVKAKREADYFLTRDASFDSEFSFDALTKQQFVDRVNRILRCEKRKSSKIL
eukprot:PhF_6_TR24765/c0_g1_i1/m.33983